MSDILTPDKNSNRPASDPAIAAAQHSGAKPSQSANIDAAEASQARHHRQLRSFMRREGRRSDNNKALFTQLFAKYGLHVTPPVNQLNFADIFSNVQPVVLEIGFGCGDSLFEMAKQHPELNFIGAEVYQTGIVKLLDKVAKAGLSNVRVINHDVVEVLAQWMPNDGLHQVQIFFPDPWPKARHHKRRLIQPDFVDLLADKMQPQGKLYLATDWQNYAEHMLEVLQASARFCNAYPDSGYAKRAAFRQVTKFEQRGIERGHGTYDLCFLKQR